MGRNPPAVPADTTVEAWRVQMAAMAARKPAERLEEWAALNAAAAEMHAQSIRRRHPGYSDRQVLVAAARAWYGAELAAAAWPDVDLADDAAPAPRPERP